MTKAFVADIHSFIQERGLQLVHFGKGEQGRHHPAFPGLLHRRGGGAVCGPSAGNHGGVAHAAALQPGHGRQLRLAGAAHRVHQLQYLLPLHREVVHQRPRLQATCDRLGPAQIEALLRKWLAILPNPFTRADEAAGYRYELSVLQAEFSLTQTLDRPVSGRIFFEQVVHDNLDIGRPDRVGLVFDRRITRTGRYRTPGRFRSRVVTDGVVPSLHIDYKNSKIKQYHKEGRALRTDHRRPDDLRPATAPRPMSSAERPRRGAIRVRRCALAGEQRGGQVGEGLAASWRSRSRRGR